MPPINEDLDERERGRVINQIAKFLGVLWRVPTERPSVGLTLLTVASCCTSVCLVVT
jgi:hypothetical protein